MNISLKKIIQTFFFVGLFFFSFNDYEGISFLGEYKKEAGAIFFFIGFLFLLIEIGVTKKIVIPYKSSIFRTLILFIVWCLVSTTLNYQSVHLNYLKHTYGINRFIRQYLSLLISTMIFFVFYWNVISRMTVKAILYKIRKVFFLSLIIASIYGFLETLVSFFGMNFVLPFLKVFDYFPFLEVKLAGLGRISSICYEPPFFAIYLISISGWMFSYVLTEKGMLKFIPTIVILVLTFFSGSRTGLLVVFFQFFIFITILYKEKSNRKYISYAALFFTFTFTFLLVLNGEKIVKAVSEKVESLNFNKNLKNNVSNQSRFGMQYAALKVFRESPIIGVGFGQQSYSTRYRYPGWATRDNYEFEYYYKNPDEPSFPPAYNIYTRLLAEVGIVGIFIFIYFIYLVIRKTKHLIKTSEGEMLILAYILLITFSGLFLNWFQIDSFRMYNIWICVAIVIKLSYIKELENE